MNTPAADGDGERGEESHSPPAQTSPGSPSPGSSTPDLLADTPPQRAEPDDDRLDLAASRPRSLFRGQRGRRSSPEEGAPARPGSASGLADEPQPSAAVAERAADVPAATPVQQQPESSPLDEGTAPGSSLPATEGRAPETEAASPRGCYSTLAAHDRGRQEASLGHELPSCFGPTDPNMRMGSPPPAGRGAALAQEMTAGESSPSREEMSSLEAASEAPARSASPVGGKKEGKSSNLSGLRDLLAPVGGLFKGAFGASSTEALAASGAANSDSSEAGDLSKQQHNEGASQDAEESPSQPAEQGGQLESMQMSEETLALCPEIGSDGQEPAASRAAFPAAAAQRAEGEPAGSVEMPGRHQSAVSARSAQAKDDLMDILKSQSSGAQQVALHTNSFAASMGPQQVQLLRGSLWLIAQPLLPSHIYASVTYNNSCDARWQRHLLLTRKVALTPESSILEQ